MEERIKLIKVNNEKIGLKVLESIEIAEKLHIEMKILFDLID